jgi:hypothetical protein
VRGLRGQDCARPHHCLEGSPYDQTLQAERERDPPHRTNSLYADIVADFIAQGTASMQTTIEGIKPPTLGAGLRRALKGVDGVKLAQRGAETYLVREATEYEDHPSRPSGYATEGG